MTNNWISGTHGIVKKADVNYVFSEKNNIYDWRIYANTISGEKVLLFAEISEARDCTKHIKEILSMLNDPDYEPIPKKKLNVEKKKKRVRKAKGENYGTVDNSKKIVQKYKVLDALFL
jgi:hypothetical protein